MTQSETEAEAMARKHVLTTNSINSPVFEREDVTMSDVHEGRIDPDGHVMLLDYDNTPAQSVAEDLAGLEGVSIIAESSPGNLHVWNLTIRSLPDTALKMIETHCDPGHIRPGKKRGYWRLRIGPKKRNREGDLEEVAPRPNLRAIVGNYTEKPQSEAHYRVAKGLWPDRMPDSRTGTFEWVGKAFTVSEYATMTEDLKQEFRQ